MINTASGILKQEKILETKVYMRFVNVAWIYRIDLLLDLLSSRVFSILHGCTRLSTC